MAEAETKSSILSERQGAVARVILNRPPLNILDLATLGEMRARLNSLFEDPSVGLVEIRAAGEKAFSVGTDIRDHFPERAPEMLREFHALIRALVYAPRPTVAVVRGHCLGGGMELATACDFILASADARFAQPEVKLGAFPPVAAALLPRLIGEKRALEMILSGEPISAEEALRVGLVNRVVAADALEDEAEKFSNALLSSSVRVSALARKSARLGSRQAFEGALREAERIYLEELLPSEDASEGLRAYLEKRPPNWKNK